MAFSRRTTQMELWLLGLLGLLGISYAISASEWRTPPFICTMTLLVLIIELFPIRLGRVNFAFCFPVLYALGIVTGWETASLMGMLALVVTQAIQKIPLRTMLANSVTRFYAVLLTGWTVRLLHIHVAAHLFKTNLLHLLICATVFTLVSTVLVLIHLTRLGSRTNFSLVIKWGVLNIVFGVLYDGFMLWLAKDPKNTGSGTLGTLYFFLPLVAVMVVVHLITGLARAKKGLETLFAVSRSINEQVELPTVLRHMVVEASRLVQGSCGLLYRAREDGTLQCEVGTMPEDIRELIPAGQGIVGAVAQLGEPLLIADVTWDARFLPQEALPDSRTVLAVPIPVDGRVAGVISLSKNEPFSFTAEDQQMMTIFATHASVAMKNALYIEEREKRLLLEERNRLAREIHDGLAQDLASMLLRIEMLKRTTPAEAERELNSLQEHLRKTSGAVRHSIYSLRPQPYSHVGLVPAIRAHLEEVAAQTTMHMHLDAVPTQEHLPPAVAKTVFQVVTEAVQNAIKHADAANLYVSLSLQDGLLRLEVRDDGRGFHFGQAILSAAAKRSFGIENLHHMADQVGGSLDFQTAPGQGTVITLEIALKEENTDDHSRAAL